MNRHAEASAQGPRQAVIKALQGSTEPLDSYQIAKAARVTPMQAGRTVLKLAAEGLAATDDPLDTVNDLAARFRFCGAAAS